MSEITHPDAARLHAAAALIQQHADLLPAPLATAGTVAGNDIAQVHISSDASPAELAVLEAIAAAHDVAVLRHDTPGQYVAYSAKVSLAGVTVRVSADVPAARDVQGRPVAITDEGLFVEFPGEAWHDPLPGGWRWATRGDFDVLAVDPDPAPATVEAAAL